MIEVNISPLLQYLRSISFVNLNKSHILLKLQGDPTIEAYGKFTSILFIEYGSSYEGSINFRMHYFIKYFCCKRFKVYDTKSKLKNIINNLLVIIISSYIFNS